MAFFGCCATLFHASLPTRKKRYLLLFFFFYFCASPSGQLGLERFSYSRVLDRGVFGGPGHSRGAGLAAAGPSLRHIVLNAVLVRLIGGSGVGIPSCGLLLSGEGLVSIGSSFDGRFMLRTKWAGLRGTRLRN